MIRLAMSLLISAVRSADATFEGSWIGNCSRDPEATPQPADQIRLGRPDLAAPCRWRGQAGKPSHLDTGREAAT